MSSDHDVTEALACVEANLNQYSDKDLVNLMDNIKLELASRSILKGAFREFKKSLRGE